MSEIRLGMIVRDRVTGLVGVAENRATYQFGCDRYCVQPRVKDDGTVPDSVMVDAPQLEIVDEPPVMTEPTEPPITAPIGRRVFDPISGKRGTVIGRAVYLNGCSRILIEPKQTSAAYEEKSVWVDEKRVDLSEDPPARVDGERRAGGPAPSSKY